MILTAAAALTSGVLHAGGSGDAVSIFINEGAGVFRTPVNISDGKVFFPGGNDFGDFNIDGKTDWVAQEASSTSTLLNETAEGIDGGCDANGTPDSCQISPDEDCQTDSVPDVCQLQDDDCNANGMPDECELPLDADCNANNVLDECDIAAGDVTDFNLNGIPDTCEREIPAVSTWSLIIFGILILVAGTLVVRRETLSSRIF